MLPRVGVSLRLACAAALFFSLSGGAGARIANCQVRRIPLPNSTFPISEGVWVGNTFYLSGMLDSSVMKGTPGDTEAQTAHALDAIRSALQGQGLGLGDIVLMHAFLGPDPAHGNKMDFAGFMKAYSRYFGTPQQPNQPARSAMQVAALAAPGALIEIEVVAVRTK